MSYKPNIPRRTDWRPQSQAEIQENFFVMNEVFGTDHYAYNHATVANRGFHNIVHLAQLSDAPTTGANQGALYSVDNEEGFSDLYFRRNNNADPLQISKSGLSVQNGMQVLGVASWNAAGVFQKNSAFASVVIDGAAHTLTWGGSYTFKGQNYITIPALLGPANSNPTIGVYNQSDTQITLFVNSPFTYVSVTVMRIL